MPRNHRIAKTVILICANCRNPFPCLERVWRRRCQKFCRKRCYWNAKNIPILERFWDAVSKTETCWLWTGTSSGYGTITGKLAGDAISQAYSAHSLSWLIHNRPIPEGLNVCHRCDVPLCVRPDHLFLGTDADNMRDMVGKGRSMFGTKNGNAKLTEGQVKEIRQRYANRSRGDVKRLAAEFGVDRTAIHHIVTRETWKHVSD